MSEVAERVEARIRAEWPKTVVYKDGGLYTPPAVREGGVTDTLIKLVARIVAEEAAEVEELAWQYREVSK